MKPPQPSTMSDIGSGPENSDAEEHVVDVLIVGGGFVGASFAAALDGSGLRVALVDRADPAEALSATFDGRAFAISAANQRMLEGIGLWHRLAATSAPILDIRVSDGPSLLFLHYDHEDVGEGPMGYMVENHHLRVALHERLRTLDNCSEFAPDRLETLEHGPGGVAATLAGGRRIRARLAVGADGRGSEIRRRAGIGLTHWDYGQVGIVCTVRHERDHEFVAHERFLAAGPFAILPLIGDDAAKANRASIVWIERAELAPAMMALDDATFVAELERRFGNFLGAVEVIGPRWSYPLSLQFARDTVAERLVLIGDAAHGMHPIAGQGLNMGLRDVATLAEVLVEAHRLGLDVGAGSVLSRYQRWRRFDNAVMLAATDVLNRLFSNDIGPLRLARDLGLAAVDKLPPLKKLFMRHAMGVVGELPKLLQGRPL
ncbi:MAG: UbiH/UbiF/VisC/COQ6 family ubiquinone biosynthesis hydroxylase [Rhodospirillaceae bacterium]